MKEQQEEKKCELCGEEFDTVEKIAEHNLKHHSMNSPQAQEATERSSSAWATKPGRDKGS